ncbi:hypothetical protein SAMN05421837_1011013 [Amycolatopsis pretoriensis]|uniref:Uncharacterized protein n=1 Tax=Amycolatopsis pretoriensis TaxID=218821 RepID=A0A1H5Q6X8_9PSEU|nr:hypothetical protein SAMN05421837_1011013 [Amycolatopsis pretoriensis]
MCACRSRMSRGKRFAARGAGRKAARWPSREEAATGPCSGAVPAARGALTVWRSEPPSDKRYRPGNVRVPRLFSAGATARDLRLPSGPGSCGDPHATKGGRRAGRTGYEGCGRGSNHLGPRGKYGWRSSAGNMIGTAQAAEWKARSTPAAAAREQCRRRSSAGNTVSTAPAARRETRSAPAAAAREHRRRRSSAGNTASTTPSTGQKPRSLRPSSRAGAPPAPGARNRPVEPPPARPPSRPRRNREDFPCPASDPGVRPSCAPRACGPAWSPPAPPPRPARPRSPR